MLESQVGMGAEERGFHRIVANVSIALILSNEAIQRQGGAAMHEPCDLNSGDGRH